MLESPATDPGRAAEEMQEVRYLRAVIDTLRQELVTERKLVRGFQADLIAARKERDEALLAERETEARRQKNLEDWRESFRQLSEAWHGEIADHDANLIALAKMYGEACTELHRLWAALDWDDEAFGMYTFRRMRERAEAAEAEAAQLRARLDEAEKGEARAGSEYADAMEARMADALLIENLRIAFLVLAESGHGGGMAEVRRWFAAGATGPIPWPGGKLFEVWAAEYDIHDCKGAMGFRRGDRGRAA